MKLRKILIVTLASTMLLQGCSINATTKTETSEESIMVDPSDVYKNLQTVTTKCEEYCEGQLPFRAIYTKYFEDSVANGNGLCLLDVVVRCGIYGDVLTEKMKQYNYEIVKDDEGQQRVMVADFSEAIEFLTKIFGFDSLQDEIFNALDKAKTDIKRLPSDTAGYQYLKEYYTTLDSMMEYATKTSGTREDAEAQFENYRATIRECDSNLKFELN